MTTKPSIALADRDSTNLAVALTLGAGQSLSRITAPARFAVTGSSAHFSRPALPPAARVKIVVA